MLVCLAWQEGVIVHQSINTPSSMSFLLVSALYMRRLLWFYNPFSQYCIWFYEWNKGAWASSAYWCHWFIQSHGDWRHKGCLVPCKLNNAFDGRICCEEGVVQYDGVWWCSKSSEGWSGHCCLLPQGHCLQRNRACWITVHFQSFQSGTTWAFENLNFYCEFLFCYILSFFFNDNYC